MMPMVMPTLTLASPGASGSLGANKALVIDGVLPATPTGLVATPGNAQNVLTWTANSESDLASYKVYGGTSSNPTTLLSTVSAGTQTYTHSSLTNGTLYYYRITALDNAGNETTFTSDVSSLPHVIDGNYSLTFDGSNDYVNLGTKSIYNLQDFTISAWFKSTWGSNNGDARIYIFGNQNRYGLFLYGNGSGGSVLRFSIEKPSGSWSNIQPTNIVNDGVWHNVVITRNNTTGLFKMYLDGVYLSDNDDVNMGGESSNSDLAGTLSQTADVLIGS